MVASTQMGLILATGPIASLLIEKFGCRKIVITGSLFAACGLIISSFAKRFIFLYVTAGIMTGTFLLSSLELIVTVFLVGIAFGLMYLPAVVIVTKYFEKKLALAMSVAFSGVGVATFTFAPIVNLLDENYGWEFSLIILGIIAFIGAPLGMLYKPNGENESAHADIDDTDAERKPSDKSKGCFKSIITSIAIQGKNYMNLFKDTRFSLFIFANFLTCLGGTIPFVFTLVSCITVICQFET